MLLLLLQLQDAHEFNLFLVCASRTYRFDQRPTSQLVRSQYFLFFRKCGEQKFKVFLGLKYSYSTRCEIWKSLINSSHSLAEKLMAAKMLS